MHLNSIELNNSINQHRISYCGENSYAPLTKPINSIQRTIENSVETISEHVEDKPDKKSNKILARVISSVLVLSGLVLVLNPKYSSKLIEKLKSVQNSVSSNFQKGDPRSLKGRFYRTSANILNGILKIAQFTNNINSGKDLCIKWLCTKEKDFSKIKGENTRKLCEQIDKGLRYFVAKPHKIITQWFDSLGRWTVKHNYKNTARQMDSLELLINQQKSKLSPEDQKILEQKLEEIKICRSAFSEEKINERFAEQENVMSNLEADFIKRLKDYKSGFTNRWVKNSEHINKNLSFWAQDIIRPERDKLEEQGLKRVSKLIGDNNSKKGLYDEIVEMLKPKININDKNKIDKSLEKVRTNIKKANHCECIEYFDKKRDLMLGSAPTDILTALFGLGVSGVLISTADSKEEKISRTLSGVFPIIAGVGASIAFTAMLFSGLVGTVCGLVTAGVLSKLGSIASHKIVPEAYDKNSRSKS